VSGPCLNVIRMRILIFVFAGLHALHMGHLAIYPVLLHTSCLWVRQGAPD
jgi:hypothetical protein